MNAIQTIVSGLLAGAVYVLVAMGFTLVFGVMRIVNFAHGELVMLGMYGALVLWTQWGVDPLLSLPLVALAVGAVGALMYRLAIRPILAAPHFNQMVMTFGLLILFQSLILLAFGGDLRTVNVSYADLTIIPWGIVISIPQLIAGIIAASVSAATYIFLERSTAGSAIRACAQDQMGYALVGGSIERVRLGTFALSAALAGAAGAVITPFSVISPFVGIDITIKAFLIVLVGGLGRVEGTLLAGVIFGMAESVLNRLLPSGFATGVLYCAVIAVVIARPRGMFRGSVG